MAPRVTIVVPAYNHACLTRRCVTSLLEHTPADLYELVVVDNGSTDDTQAVLAAMDGAFSVLYNRENVGFGNACNQGAAAGGAPYVCFFSNDVVAQANWLPPLLEALEEDPRRAAVQPRLLFPDGRLNDAGGLVFAGGQAWVYGRGDPFPYSPQFSCRRAPDYASGACLVVRADAFRQVGGFDPRYSPAYYEDTDLSFSFRQAGFTVLYEPASTVVHAEGSTNGTDTSSGDKSYQPRNLQLFADKWSGELALRPPLEPALVDRWAHRPQGGWGPGEKEVGRRAASVLIVDVVPPMFDRAAGSLRTFQMTRCLRAAGHAVGYYAAGAAYERVRYGAALSRLGVPLFGADPKEVEDIKAAPKAMLEMWVARHAPDITALCLQNGYDTVVLTPWTTAEAFMAKLRFALPGVKLVVDTCDLSYLREEREAGLKAEPAEQEAARLDRARREKGTYAAADTVICVSQSEADVLCQELPGTEVAVVGLGQDALAQGPGFSQRQGLLLVANANHTPNVDGLAWYADQVAPVLEQALPGVKLTVVGNDPAGALARWASESIEVLGWVPDTLPYLHRARVSIAPLRYGAGVKGKVLEAVAAGLPLVGTAVAVEGTGLQAGRDALVADDPANFAAAIAMVYRDQERWEAQRAAGCCTFEASQGLRAMAEGLAPVIGHGPALVPDPWTSPFATVRATSEAAGPTATDAPSYDLSSPSPQGLGASPPARTSGATRGRGRRQPRPSRVASRPQPQAGEGKAKVLMSACLIVKDEEQALPDCLRSLARLVDEVVIYDTGSTDSTVKLARKMGARVIEGYWDDDFGRARNASLAHCQGEWVLWIDADERFVCSDPRDLRGALENHPELDALMVEIQNLVGDGKHVGNLHRAFRLFRRSTCQWYGKLHEQVDLRPGLPGKVTASPLEGAHLLHIGYTEELIAARDKLARNLHLAEVELASGVVKDVYLEGVAELNLARALAALGRHAEAQPYVDIAVEKTRPGPPRRSALLYQAHNLSALGRFEETYQAARALEETCENKGLAMYMQGSALRRLGRPQEAVDIFRRITVAANEDGFALPDSTMRAELAGALLELGRAGEAADELVKVIQDNPELAHISAAFKVFALTGKSVESLIAAMPEDRLDRVAAALVLVPPVVAAPMAEALWDRFGAKPQLLAAAIKFAPFLPVERALDWSARLRAIGMDKACPLLAQAALQVLEAEPRLRAAVIAHAAFGDANAAQMAVGLVAGVPVGRLGAVLAEVDLLDAALLRELAVAASGEGAPGLDVGSAAERTGAVEEAMTHLAQSRHAAQVP